jgi:transcriptional regulator with XRE-family HTH domain
MKSLAIQSLPPELEAALKKVGKGIRRARVRRDMTQEELGLRAMVSRKTISNLENGSPEVSMGILLQVLHVLGMHDQFAQLAAPEADETGKALEERKLPARAHAPKRLADMIRKKK